MAWLKINNSGYFAEYFPNIADCTISKYPKEIGQLFNENNLLREFIFQPVHSVIFDDPPSTESIFKELDSLESFSVPQENIKKLKDLIKNNYKQILIKLPKAIVIDKFEDYGTYTQLKGFLNEIATSLIIKPEKNKQLFEDLKKYGFLEEEKIDVIFCKKCKNYCFNKDSQCIHCKTGFDRDLKIRKIYMIKENLFHTWENNPEIFLEPICFHTLKPVFQENIYANLEIYHNRDKRKGAYTEFDVFIKDKKIVILCSKSNSTHEKRQIKKILNLGLKVIFVSYKKLDFTIGNKSNFRKIDKISEIINLKETLIKVIDSLK